MFVTTEEIIYNTDLFQLFSQHTENMKNYIVSIMRELYLWQ
jgi:hypothetical protein